MKQIIISAIYLGLVLSLGIQISFAQTTQVDEGQMRRQEEIRQQMNVELERRERNLRSMNPGRNDRPPVQTIVLSKEQQARLSDRTKEMLENAALVKKMSAVSPEYYKKYEKLLKDKKVDLFRIFPEKGCYEGKIVKAGEMERCVGIPPVKGGGSYYSFRLKTNSYLDHDWWDIHFSGSKLVFGNDTVQAVVSEIGQENLEDVKFGSRAFKFLADYKPKNTIREIKEDSKLLEKGVNFNGFTYSNSTAIKLDSTYAARIIAYQLKNEPVNRPSFSPTSRQLDITLVFKVVGAENDGSLVILWKELKTELPRRKLTEK